MQLGFRVGDALRTAIELLLLFCLLASCGQAMDYSGCQKCLGGGGDDEAHSLQQTSDDGYAVAGFAKSNDYNASSNHGSRDYGIVELGEINCTITAPDKVCPGSTGNVASTAESDADYDWSITNGTITSKSNAQSIKFTAGSSGTIRLTVEVNKKGSRARCIKDIAIKPTVNCSWTSNAPVCDDIVRFNGPAGMDTYQWDFGDGDSSPLEDPIHRYRKFGTYTVKLTVTSCGISKTGKGPVEVRTQPDCSWTSNAPVCNGTPVQFSGPAGMDSYQWDFGDGAISSSKDPSHLYRAPGIYAINLTTTKCNIAKTCPGTVEVKGPDCSWTSNAPVCEGTEVQFSGPSGMDSYYWRFGDGLTSSDKDPAHLYRVPGTYTVKLTVTSCSSSKTCTGSVTVKPQPDCSWTSNAPVCKGTPVQFTGPAGMESYHWDFGDHSPGDRAMSPSHLYQDPGTYTVKLTVTSCGSSKTCTGSVVVTAIDCSWTSNAPVCNGTAVQFNGPAGMDSYQWEFGDNQSSSSKDPSHLYRAPGIYAVNLTVSKGGCTKSCPGSVEVKGPDCRWTSNAPVCIGTPVQFSGPSGMDSYFWDFGDGALSSAQGVSHLYTAPRTYTVSLKATKGSCSASCRSTVVVSPMPDCSWTSNAPVCDGTSVQFTGPSAMDSYYWEFGDGQVGSIKDPAHLYSAPGTYTVNLTVSKGGCSKSCTGSVVVTAIDCRWTSSSPVCNGTAVQFTGPSAMDSYQWEFGDGAVSSAQGVSHLYSAPGTYSVNLKATKGGCSASCRSTVVVSPMPDCSWTSNSSVCNGTAVQFTGPSGMNSYQWEFGDNQSSSSKDPAHLYSAPGTYAVNLTVDKGGCTKTCPGSVVVTAIDCSWTSNSPVCNGTPVQFKGPSAMGTYLWDFGDGAVSSDKNPSHLYRSPGTYAVSLKATNSSCTKTCMGTVEVRSSALCGKTIYLKWQKCFGGSLDDGAYSILQTADGGYVVAGDTKSKDGDVRGNHGESDCWIVKLDASGKKDWQKCLGGSGDDTAYSIQQTADVGSDGGYVVAGETASIDGNVKGNHGSYDYWVVKLNASGKIEWQKCLGGGGEDTAYGIQQTTDGGYIVAGNTYSNGGDVSDNHGQRDCWLVRLDASGNIKWQKCLGGSSNDNAYSVQRTADGGYIVAGDTESKDGDVRGNHGQIDCWIVRLDASGNIKWQKCLGGSGKDTAYSIQQTADGGYVVAGNTQSNDGDVSGNHGGESDCWLAKLDRSGNLVWQKCLGGSRDDEAYSVRQTDDGGYVVAGYTQSNDGDVSGRYGMGYWVVKLGASGNMEWERCLEGSTFDKAYGIRQTDDGGYVVAGRTFSFDSIGSGGNYDLCVAKLSKINCTIAAPDIVYSGSTGNLASTAESGADYNWSITDGTITSPSDAQLISFSVGTSGTTRLTVNVTRPVSWNECHKDIAIKPKPGCSWTSNAPVCNGTAVQFTGPAGMDSYQWDFGDGAVSSAQGASHLYSAPGTYTVNLKATRKGSSENCLGTVVVKSQPDCSWTSSSPVCNGTAIRFKGPSGMDAYQWDFGDGAVSSAKDPSHLYRGLGTYTVNLKATKSGCSKTCTGSVVVTAIDCSWTSNAPVCNGTAVQFSGPAGMDSYQWEFGDNQSSSSKDPAHLYSAPGTYAVNLKTTKGGCTKSCMGSIVVKPIPDCSWTSNAPVCNGTPVQLTGPSAMDSYQWEFGDGQVGSGKDPAHLYRSPGTYTVNLKATKSGCSKSCTGSVVVTALDCSWTSNAPVCNGTPVQFTGPAGMDSYQWDFGDGAVSSAQGVSHLYSAPGTYTVSLKATNGSCTKNCTGTVVVTALDCSWTSNAPVCNGTPVQFTGPAGMDSYYWDFGDGAVSSTKDPSHLYSAPGTYTVNLKVTKGGCTKTCPGSVVVTAIDCSWTSNSPVCNGTPVQFTGPSGMDSYSWEFGDGAVSPAKDPAHLYSAPGTYTVNLKVTKGSSSKSCKGLVEVKACPFNSAMSYGELLKSQGELVASFGGLLKNTTLKTDRKDFYNFSHSFDDLVHRQKQGVYSYEDLVSHSWSELSDQQKIEFTDSFESLLRQVANLISCEEDLLKRDWCTLSPEEQGYFLQRFGDDLHYQQMLIHKFEDWLDHQQTMEDSYRDWWMRFLDSFEDLIRRQSNLMDSFEMLMKIDCTEEYISLTRSANVTEVNAGAPVEYTYKVTATRITVKDVVVKDSLGGEIGTIDRLEPGVPQTLTKVKIHSCANCNRCRCKVCSFATVCGEAITVNGNFTTCDVSNDVCVVINETS